MKKIVLVVALAAMLVFAGASVALAKNGGSKVISNSTDWGNVGYINWRTASVGAWATGLSAGSLTAEQADGPHASYTTTTVKCAVCHSIHLAPTNSFLLTKVTGTGAGSAELVCRFCHYDANTLGIKAVAFDLSTPAQQHSDKCSAADGTGCHASAHGAGVSTYDTLAAALIGKRGDARIAMDIVDTANTGLVAGDFALAGVTPITGDQRTLRAAYTCGRPGCHANSAFAAKPGKSMSVNAPGGAATAYKSTHPMFASDGVISPANTQHGSYTGQIAWAASAGDANSTGCSKCHALTDPNVPSIVAFPHDRFDKRNGVWLVAAGYFGDTIYSVNNHEWNPTSATSGTGYTAPYSMAADVEFGMSTLRDGVCLRCHKGSATTGVGVNF